MKNKKIGLFKATNKNPSQYKSNDSFINALYMKNKAFVSSKSITKTQFKERMKDILDEGFTRREAARLYSRTRSFMSKESIGLLNIRENLSRNEASRLRKYASERSGVGYRKTKINWSDYSWDKDLQGYVDSGHTHMIKWGRGENSWDEDWIDIVRI